jgi:hypothetical protein
LQPLPDGRNGQHKRNLKIYHGALQQQNRHISAKVYRCVTRIFDECFLLYL